MLAPNGRLGSIGRELSGSGPIRLLDENGNDVAEGEVGELHSHTPWCFEGYWKLPDKTAEAFRGPYLSVGDLARRDAEGYYQLFEAGRAVTEMSTTLGRSAKHISARLALLELPKKARRALERNKITLGDAEALLAAREHPDLIDATIDALDGEGGCADVRRSIESALRDRRREESVAALVAQAEARGQRVIPYEGYQPP